MDYDFEEDLQKLKERIQDDLDFATDVYAALCNMRWKRGKEIYSCSWRYAGGLVAEIRDGGESYMDFYCSGNEGTVTEEVKTIFGKLGWEPYPWEEDDD